MIIAGWQFTPRLWSSMAAVVMIGMLIALGNWQLNRAREKQHLQERYDMQGKTPAVMLPGSPVKPGDYQFRRVEVEGVYAPQYMVYLDNKVHGGVIGYQVVMPLRIGASNMHVLVNRGWIAGSGRRDRLPQVPTPSETVKVSGVAIIPSDKFVELSAQTVEGRVWENLVLDRFRANTRLEVQPVVIQQQDNVQDGLVREWERPDIGVDKHLARAFTWYTLAVTVFIIYVILNVRRSSSQTQ